jgi:predicted alpha/beta superfamily hydrolase
MIKVLSKASFICMLGVFSIILSCTTIPPKKSFTATERETEPRPPLLRTILLEAAESESGEITYFPDFEIPQLDRVRDIWVYTPPGYDNSGTDYPVIYMHDGQNLFYPELSFAGEWEVDETLDGLFALNLLEGVIVVGIANGESYRGQEYVAYEIQANGNSSRAADYLSFLVETLKPFIDENYRTLKDSENTALAGSSFGGHISLYGGLLYPEVFGIILAFSPSLWPADQALVKEILSSSSDLSGQRIYLDYGVKEGDAWVLHSISELSGIYLGKGAEETFYFFGEGDWHNEQAWRKRFPIALSWAFGFDLPASAYR